MSKKNRKSLFTWCIRTLAVSLVPTLILVSCASDSDDDKAAADTTAPTFSTALGGSTIVGTNNLTVTFNEAVTGVSGNEIDGTCDATKTVKLTNYAGTCYGMTIVAVGNVYTIDPKTDLISGSYTLTMGAGIKDAAGNALSESTISFTVEDAKTTIITNLTAALAGVTGSAEIISAVTTAISQEAVTNDLLNAIPSSFDAAITKMNTMTDIGYGTTLTKVIVSLFGNLEEPTTGSTSRSKEAQVAASTVKEIGQKVTEIGVTKVPKEEVQNLTDTTTSQTLKNTPDDKKAEAVAGLATSVVKGAEARTDGAAAEVVKSANAGLVSANAKAASKTYPAATAVAATKAALAEQSVALKASTNTDLQTKSDEITSEGTTKADESKTVADQAEAAAAAPSTGDETGDGTITTPASPNVTLAVSSISANEKDAGSITLTATQSAAVTTEATTITLATSGTAGSSDFTLSSSTITIAAGSKIGTSTITIANDVIPENSETIVIDISKVSGGDNATESGTQQTTVTIPSNDPTITLTASSSSVNEGDSSRTVTLTATQSAAVAEATTITLASSGTADSNDFSLSSKTIAIGGGSTTGTATLTIENDTTTESSETVIIDISNVDGGNGATESATQQQTITIADNDDDTAPTINGEIVGWTEVKGVRTVTTKTPVMSIYSSENGTLAFTDTNCKVGSSASLTGKPSTDNYTMGAFVGDFQNIRCTFTVTDAANNASTAFTNTQAFSVDFNAPKVSTVTMDTVDNTTSNAIQFDLNTITDNGQGTGTGTAAYYVKDNSDNTTSRVKPAASASGWVNVPTSFDEGDSMLDQSYTLTDKDDNETKNISIFFKDNAGSVSDAFQTTFRLGSDTTKPTLSNMMIRDVGTNVDNATFTDNETVKVIINAADAQSGIRYVIVTDNMTIANRIDNGTYSIDNLTSAIPTFIDGTKVIKSDNSTNFLSDNGSQVIVTGAFISNLTSGNKQLWSWVADGAKNISDNNTAASSTDYGGFDSILLDSTHPTATILSMIGLTDNLTPIDNQTYTDNHTVTIRLDYNDNATVQYFISETNSAPSQYVDNISGAIKDNLTTRAFFTAGYNFDSYIAGDLDKDNATSTVRLTDNSIGDNLTRTVWSILDNGTNDNASTYTVSDNYTGDNQTITYNLSAGDGLKTVYVWVKDAANNISQVANDNITVDTTGPVTNNQSWSLGAGTVTDNLTVVIDNVTLFQDSLSGGVYKLYFNDNGTTAPTTAGQFNRTPQGTADNLTFTFGTDGAPGTYAAGDNLSLYVWAIDNLSNISSTYLKATTLFDNASPTGTYSAAGDNATITNASFTADNQTFFLHTTSPAFGLTGVGVDNTTLTYLVMDNVTAPGSADNATVAKNASGSFTSSATDSTYYSLSEFDNKTLYIWAKDAAGNVSASPVDNLTVTVDNTAPIWDNLTLVAHDNGTGTLISVGDDNATVMVDNVTDNFSGLYGYHISTVDNYSSSTRSNWVSFAGGSDNITFTVPVIGNHEEGATNIRTVYVTFIDKGNKASATQTLNINSAEDNPVTGTIALYNDNSTNTTRYAWSNDNGTDNATGNKVTVQIAATDNNTVTSYHLTRDGSYKPSLSETWDNFSTPGTHVSENVTYTFPATGTFSLSNIDNASELKLYVWVRDNSSNISDNYSVDNITYYK
jgi:hypothetical protein